MQQKKEDMFIIIGLISHAFFNCYDSAALIGGAVKKEYINDYATTQLEKPNIFNDCRLNKAILTIDIQYQLLVKKLDQSSIEFLQKNTAVFQTAWEDFSKRCLSSQRLLKVYEKTNKTLLYANGTVIFPDEPAQLKNIAFDEWICLNKKMRTEFKIFLSSHEKFLDLFRAEFSVNRKSDLAKALKGFSYRYLLISNLYRLAVEHKKELKTIQPPHYSHNCNIL